MNNEEMEREIIDTALSIPLEEWMYGHNSRLQALFKGKCIQLSETKYPNGRSYSTVHIDGISFRDESSDRVKQFYKHIFYNLKRVEELKNLDKIKSIYSQLKS